MAITTAQKTAASAAIVASIIVFTAPFEGERHTAYRDIAKPEIWTICDGETQGVHQGMVMNHQQCMAEMARRVPAYLGPVDKMMLGLPDNRRIAYADFAWNEGDEMLRRRALVWVEQKNGTMKAQYLVGSSIVELERGGRWQDACHRLLKFNTAGGEVLPGLVKRRKAEEMKCLALN